MTGKLLYWVYGFSVGTCSEYVFKESFQFADRVKHPSTEADYPACPLKLWKPLRIEALTLRSAGHRAWTPLFCTGITQLPFWLQLYTPVEGTCWLRFRLHSSAPRPFCLFFIRSNSLKQWKLWELAAVCENTIYSTSMFRLLRQYKFLPARTQHIPRRFPRSTEVKQAVPLNANGNYLSYTERESQSRREEEGTELLWCYGI